MDEQTRLRKLWREHFAASSRAFQQWADAGYPWNNKPDTLPFPDELRGLTCGAKTRAGTPCKLTSLYGNGRCKFHGGLSTGPTTDEGKRRVAANLPRKAHAGVAKDGIQSP